MLRWPQQLVNPMSQPFQFLFETPRDAASRIAGVAKQVHGMGRLRGNPNDGDLAVQGFLDDLPRSSFSVSLLAVPDGQQDVAMVEHHSPAAR